MGFEYAIVHLKYTIPLGLLLSYFYRPFLTRTDIYKITFLVIVAVVSTIPWDSYLIRTKVWTYPPEAMIGPRLFQIPAEEIFFFVIQTYNTTLIYLILSKPTFFPIYLQAERPDSGRDSASKKLRYYCTVGQIALVIAFSFSVFLVYNGGPGTYFGLIIAWATPFLLLLWSLAYQFLVALPWTNTMLPIALPTVYLWIVDTLALRRGTWSIESGTKLGLCIWPYLDIEEAIFFLLTNCLVVFGLVAFDNALAILHTFTTSSEIVYDLPSPTQLITALLMPATCYDETRILGLQDAVTRLRKKSRSFYLASSVFQGKLRAQLIVLYSFCRVADDLVDNAKSKAEAEEWILKLENYLNIRYDSSNGEHTSLSLYVRENFPIHAQSALLLLAAEKLSKEPLYELLRGFEIDIVFSGKPKEFPIKTDTDLDLYGARVAGTVAQLCNELVYALKPDYGSEVKSSVIASGKQMGVALQCVNIARDIAVDAEIGRVYIPTTWLKDMNLTPQNVLQEPNGHEIEALRSKLLDKAFSLYEDAKDAIEDLPSHARGPIRVAVESYMEIGRVLREGKAPIKHGRATVPRIRRMMVVWSTMK